ncbi:hypothetical protein K439DRAFT_1643638 [Ramaria rubella]|nr:hypothetical protein K439DRAFT_1643638 [Ramaria rubella]
MRRVRLQSLFPLSAASKPSSVVYPRRGKKFVEHKLFPRLFSNCPSDFSSLQKAYSGPYPTRTHTCGSLRFTDVGQHVVLAGWLMPERKVSKSLSFFTLKDSSGSTQLVVTDKQSEVNILESMRGIVHESSVLVEGIVTQRPLSAQRSASTGGIEVQVNRVLVFNPVTSQLPFIPSDNENLANEDLRLKHRYLDLRRDYLSQNMHRRHTVAHITRNFLHELGFLEVETPILLKSSPEGAREFLVPSRSSGGAPMFYALAQSPQQPKQLLICSGGIDKYYQIARCFRDEDGRKDRQPEFTQIDMELAYISWGQSGEYKDGWNIGGGEIRVVVESLLTKIWKEIEDVQLDYTFPVMTYKEAMSRYGSDKPDTRFLLEVRLRPARYKSDTMFHAAAETLASSDSAVRVVERVLVTSSNITTWPNESRILLSFSDYGSIESSLNLDPGDIVWIGKRSANLEGASTPLGQVRVSMARLAEQLGHYTPSTVPHFLWVTEFPLFTRADKDKDFLARGRWSSSHHPFTAPMSQDMDAFWSGQIAEVRGQHYDLVLNGTEVGGGSVRIHDPAMQDHVLSQILQLNEKEQASFDHLLHALRCGAPPHGGIAIGFDRLMAIICHTQSIRDVIAFPKTAGGVDPLLRSPSTIDDQVLRQYSLQSVSK